MALTRALGPSSGGVGVAIFDLLRGAERPPIPTAVDHAYEMIWQQLIQGNRQPGERLADTELAAQLGLSRTPVRQALHRLAQEELVRFDPRRGFSVRTFTAHDVHEIYDLRGALEVLALRLSAPQIHQNELVAQLAVVDELRGAVEGERQEAHGDQGTLAVVDELRGAVEDHAIARFLQSDFRLHNLLIHTSGNGRLIRMLASLRSQLSIFQIRDTSYPRRVEIALDDHERILRALLEGDINRAEVSLAQHIVHAKHGVLEDLFGGTDRATSTGKTRDDAPQPS